MSESLISVSLFLINTLFDLYLLILMTRVILVWVHADFFNPLSQIIIKLTNPLITPLRRVIPNFKRVESSTLLLVFVLCVLKFFLIGWITIGLPNNIFGLFIIALADMTKLLLNVFFYAILIQALLSWLQQIDSPMIRGLEQITSPIMHPLRRLIPPVGGFDLSPIPAIIVLQCFILFLQPLFKFGMLVSYA